MAHMKDHPSSTRVKIMVCAPSKQGKTSLLATLANAGYNVAIADFDNGLDVLPGYLTKEGAERTHYITFEDDIPKKKSAWGKFLNIMDHGWKDEDEDLGKLEDWDESWVFAIDTGMTLSEAAMRAVQSQNGQDVNAQPRLQDYRELNAMVYNRIVKLLSNKYKFNFVLNTHVNTEEDDLGRTFKVPGFVGRALGESLPKRFNSVVRIDAKPNGSRVIRTTSDNRMALGTSAGSKIKPEFEMDLAKLFEELKNAGS